MCVVRDAVHKGVAANTIARGNGWSKSSVSKVVARIKKGPTARRAGSGRKTEYAPAKIDEVEKALTQTPQQSMDEVAQATAVSTTTARRIVKQKPKFKPLKTIQGKQLAAKQREKRKQWCAEQLERLANGDLDTERVFWTDGKLFKVTGAPRGGSTQNCRVWVPKGTKKKDLKASQLTCGNKAARFSPTYCLVAMGVSERGSTPPHFCPKCLMIDPDAYQAMVRNAYAPFTQSMYYSEQFVFHQDRAAPRASASSAEALANISGRKNITKNPPNSPDLSALDFHACGAMDKKVQLLKPKTIPQLKAAVCKAWPEIDMAAVGAAIRESWPARLRKFVEANGRRFEHSLRL